MRGGNGLSAAQGGSAYAEARPVRRLGRGLRRRRRLRVGITQLFYVIVGVVLGLLIPHVLVGFTVPRAETVQMLFAVGAGLLTFIGVIFSLLFLVVQFGSTTFTPRLNLFYTSPIVWHAFGFYTGACSCRLPAGPTTCHCRSTSSSRWAPATRRCGGASSEC